MKKFNEKFNLIMEEAHIEENASYEVIVNRSSYVDDYNEGETKLISDEIVFEDTTKNLKNALEEIIQTFNLPKFSTLSEDNWFINYDNSAICHNRMEDRNSNIVNISDEANKELVERWKAGEEELYAVYFEIYINKIIKSNLSAKDIIEITGFKFSTY